MRIQAFLEKCKSNELFTALLIVLVGTSAFGLGRLSKINDSRPAVFIEAPKENTGQISASSFNEAATSLSESTTDSDGEVVASKNGQKYHYPWCAGSRTIADKNKIWFNSIAAARASGYTPASNCKGLK